MSINLDIVFVAARRAETALAAERNEFKISAMRTGIHVAAVRRGNTMNHLVDFIHLRQDEDVVHKRYVRNSR